MENAFMYWWPITLTVAGSTLYQVFAKKLAGRRSPIAILALMYLVSAAICAGLFEILVPDGHLWQQLQESPVGAVIMGASVVGLEIGGIYGYKNGWAVNLCFAVYTALTVVLLLLVGTLAYGEPLALRQVAGAAIAAGGMYLIVR